MIEQRFHVIDPPTVGVLTERINTVPSNGLTEVVLLLTVKRDGSWNELDRRRPSHSAEQIVFGVDNITLGGEPHLLGHVDNDPVNTVARLEPDSEDGRESRQKKLVLTVFRREITDEAISYD